MIGVQSLVLWICVCHVSAQVYIPGLGYKWFQNNFGGNVANDIHSPAVVSSGISYVPVITKQCESMGICEDVPNYPEEHVKTVLQQANSNSYKFLGNVFNSDVEPRDEYGVKGYDFDDLCPYETKYIIPRAAKNLNNEWQFIVNTADKAYQTYTVEVCKNQMGPCSTVATFPASYSSWCQQKFILISMAAINKKGVLVEEPHQIPSCCSCVFRGSSHYK